MTDEQYKDFRKGIGYLIAGIQYMAGQEQIIISLLSNLIMRTDCKDKYTDECSLERLLRTKEISNKYFLKYKEVKKEMTNWRNDQQP